MDYERKTKELEMSFDLTDELLLICVKDTEEETRAAIKEEITKRFDKAKDDVARTAIILTEQRFKAMSFEEIKELAELLNGDDF